MALFKANFALAAPDTPATCAALRSCDLTVQVSTKLNRSHVVHGRAALILPCLGRTEKDHQRGGVQSTSVEDSMSMVHMSVGMKRPASPHLLSELTIVAGMARAALPDSETPWDWYIEDYEPAHADLHEPGRHARARDRRHGSCRHHEHGEGRQPHGS